MLDTILADEAQHRSAQLYACPSLAMDHAGTPVSSPYVNKVWTRAKTANSPVPLAYHYEPWSKIVQTAFVREHALAFGPQKAGQDAVFALQLALHQPHTLFLDMPWYVYTMPHPQRPLSPLSIQGAFEAHRFVQRWLHHHHDHMRGGALGLVRRGIKHSPRTTLIETLRTLRDGSFFPPLHTLGPRLRRRLNNR